MESMPELIQIKEHELLPETVIDDIQVLGIQFKETKIDEAPKYLGIKPNYEASYFIGADWLAKDLPIAVLPKMSNIDYIEMFLCSLQFDLASDYFSKIYAIDFDKKEIQCNGLKDQITPLLIIHFLSLIKRIVKRGLKRDYVIREQNLTSKIKGHILISKNIHQNEICKRYNSFFCRFQEYTMDYPENRLLKKALLFIEQYLSINPELNIQNKIRTELNNSLAHFHGIDDNIEISQIKTISANKIYKEYTEAIRLAKLILRRFSYSIHEAAKKPTSIPVFWMDMSRLYEVYVYSLLHKAYGNTIEFQVNGYYKTAVDFIKKDQRLIIDTKYKPRYGDGNRGIIDDIRQISSYARDEKILQELLGEKYKEDIVPDCLIIYPEKDDNQDDPDKEITKFEGVDLIKDAVKIKAFRNFYKISVPLPVINIVTQK